ncbi:MAG: xylose isomerase [Gemmatimonadetes bacterium]|mgnify:CR=1 FL=1|nr:xylose isomerase [Gemmatimonadota bacterium]|tara:strand:+ start:2562 stop:3380 length:819 start_codon:yes stop_codon:yes gene_type:complete
MPRLSISSWSLHRLLGKAWYDPDGNGGYTNRSDETPQIELLDVPGQAAAHGIGTLELCHFHFPSTDDAYLERLKQAIRDAGVELFSILIDTGDITADDEATRTADTETVRFWVDIAAKMGAGHVRIIAGDAEADENAIAQSVDGLRSLASYAKDRGVIALTENFRRLAARPETCVAILEGCEGEVGLCADFGNFPQDTRSTDLAAVLLHANSIHAKADYADGEMDRVAYQANVKLAVDAGFDGPMSLIYQDGDDVWESLDEMRDVTLEVIGS